MKKLLLSMSLLSTISMAASEKMHSFMFCANKGGASEVRTHLGNWVDCVTDTHAIEVEWANKYKYGLGQALTYSFETGKKAAVALIYKKPEDIVYGLILRRVIKDKNLEVDVFEIDVTGKAN